MTTSIAFPPSKLVRGRSELVPTSIGVARRGDYAICGSATPGQFGLQALRLLFHSHPAHLANAFDEIVRPALAFWRIIRLWLLERHWHERPPRYAFAFSFSFVRDGPNRWRADRARLAASLAFTDRPSCARVQECAATYCGESLTSVPIPKFACFIDTPSCELRNQKG